MEEQLKIFDAVSNSKVAVESKNSTKLKALEKEIEELKRKVDLIYKSLRK